MAGYYGRDTPFAASVTSPIIEQAQTRLCQSERNYSRTQQDLQNAMRIRATTPMSAVESSAKDQEIMSLQLQLHEQEAEIKRLRETITRQQITIKTQSEAIANPKQHYATPTPNRFGGNQQYGPHPNLPLPPPPPPPPIFTTGNAITYTQPHPAMPAPSQPQQPSSTPSPFDDSGARRSNALPTSQSQGPQMHHPQPTPFRPSGHVNEFGSPEPARSYNTNFTMKTTPTGPSSGTPASASAARMHTRGMPSTALQQQPQMPAFPSPIALVFGPHLVVSDAVVQKFGNVIHMAEVYAFSHVNTPSTQKDNAMPQEVKDRLMRASSTTSAFQFMQTPYTRYMLVNKIIVQFIIRTILKHDCFTGFDPEADRVIENCKSQMYQTTPAQVKYQLLATMAEQIQKLKMNPHFQNFVNNIARSRGNEIWKVLKPMMHTKTSRDWDDLHELMINAHQLAQMMFSGSEEYKFDFPVMGQLFSNSWMEPRDPFRNFHSPEQLEAMGATVRLGITPLISVRSSTPSGHVKSCCIVKAFVLIKAEK